MGQEISLNLDINSLPAAEAQNLLRLVNKADFFKLPEDLIALSTPDEFQYTITLESGDSRHTVRVSDTSAPESLRMLLEELTILATIG